MRRKSADSTSRSTTNTVTAKSVEAPARLVQQRPWNRWKWCCAGSVP